MAEMVDTCLLESDTVQKLNTFANVFSTHYVIEVEHEDNMFH